MLPISESQPNKIIYVINSHLQGGQNQEGQRVFQLRSAIAQLNNQIKKDKVKEDEIHCFLCGDFNAESDELVHNYLTNQDVTQEEREKYFPEKNSGFSFKHNLKLEDSHSHRL